MLFLDLPDLDRFRNHLLLHDVGLYVVGFVGLRLLALHGFQVLRLLDFQIALGFGLLAGRERFGQHPLLIGVGTRHGGGPLGVGALDRGIALGFGGGDIGVAPDAGYVGAAHVGDVLVLVAHFLDGERDHLQAHLGDVVGAGGAHAVGYHFRLLDDLFHGQLADDAA